LVQSVKNEEAVSSAIGRARSFVRLRDNFVFWPIVILGLAFDLWTKKAVFEWLQNTYPHVYVVISGFLRLVIQENTGAAFGIASGQRTLLTIVSLTAALFVLGFFFFGRQKKARLTIALAMFLAGILGNAYDRLFNNGMVRDFIDVHYKDLHWPAFNVADSMLCVAVFLLFIGCAKTSKRT
jgi:signal peptidase II